MWLSGLGVVLHRTRWQFDSPVRACAWVADLVPRRSTDVVSLFLPPFSSLSLKRKEKVGQLTSVTIAVSDFVVF